MDLKQITALLIATILLTAGVVIVLQQLEDEPTEVATLDIGDSTTSSTATPPDTMLDQSTISTLQDSIPPVTDAPETNPVSVLIFSETADHQPRPSFIQEGIAAGQDFLSGQLQTDGASVEITNTSDGFFNDEKLSEFDVVVFLSNSGDALNETEQQSFERFIQAGNGFVGIHYAGLAEGNRVGANNSWGWYSGLIGRKFDGLVAFERFDESRIEEFSFDAMFNNVAFSHPTMSGVPQQFDHRDELYRFEYVSSNVTDAVLLLPNSIQNADDSYPNKVTNPHPVAWYQENYDGGKSFYTSLGDSPESYETVELQTMLTNAIQWAAE